MSTKLGKRARAAIERRFIIEVEKIHYLGEARIAAKTSKKANLPGMSQSEVTTRAALLLAAAMLLEMNAYEVAEIMIEKIDEMPFCSSAWSSMTFEEFVKLRGPAESSKAQRDANRAAGNRSYFDATGFLALDAGTLAAHG